MISLRETARKMNGYGRVPIHYITTVDLGTKVQGLDTIKWWIVTLRTWRGRHVDIAKELYLLDFLSKDIALRV